MKPFILEFEATEENSNFHFEKEKCNLEFVFGMPQTHIIKIYEEGPFLSKIFIPFTAHNLGLCTVTFEISAGVYNDDALKGAIRYPKSQYSEILIAPNEYFAQNISLKGDSFLFNKIVGQIRLECEDCLTEVVIDKKRKSKKKS